MTILLSLSDPLHQLPTSSVISTNALQRSDSSIRTPTAPERRRICQHDPRAAGVGGTRISGAAWSTRPTSDKSVPLPYCPRRTRYSPRWAGWTLCSCSLLRGWSARIRELLGTSHCSSRGARRGCYTPPQHLKYVGCVSIRYYMPSRLEKDVSVAPTIPL